MVDTPGQLRVGCETREDCVQGRVLTCGIQTAASVRARLKEVLYWTSLETSTWLSSSCLGQIYSFLWGLKLRVQLEREFGSPAPPGNGVGRMAEDRHKILILKNVCLESLGFHTDMPFEGWRTWLEWGVGQGISQGGTRSAHSLGATCERLDLSYLYQMPLHISKPHYGLKLRSICLITSNSNLRFM